MQRHTSTKWFNLLQVSCNFTQKETPTQVFSCAFCEILMDTFFYSTLPVAAFGSEQKTFFITFYFVQAVPFEQTPVQVCNKDTCTTFYFIFDLGTLPNVAFNISALGHQSHKMVKETLARVFSCEFYQISKNTFFTEHLR